MAESSSHNKNTAPEHEDAFSSGPSYGDGLYRSFRPSLGIDLRDVARIPFWVVLIAFCLWSPLGILLFIARLLGKQQVKEEGRWREDNLQRQNSGSPYNEFYGKSGTSSRKTSAETSAYGSASSRSSTRNQRQEKKKDQSRGSVLPIVLLVCGIIALITGISEIYTPLQSMILYGFNRFELWDLFSNLGWVASGGVMVYLSRFFKKRNRQWKKLTAIVGNHDNISVEEIAASLPASMKDTRHQLETAIDHEVFGPSAFLDMRTDTLVVRGPAPEPAKPAQTFSKADPDNPYASVLQQLRQVNEAIPGEEMTEKIDRLETLTKKILDIAQKDPSKLPQMRRFMDYYLPTALKLLKSYAQFDRQGVDGGVISDSKKSIEETMDTLITGFEQQLDKLFQDDALDVSTDISVLKNMMEQDGLSGVSSPFETK